MKSLLNQTIMKPADVRATISLKASAQSPSRDANSLSRTSILYTNRKAGGSPTRLQKRTYIDSRQAETFVANIHGFLLTRNFPHALTRQSIKVASLATFNNILIFLLNKLDPSIETLDIYSENLVELLHCFGCPIALARGVLKNLGTPNNWNQALGALNWLVETVEEKDRVLATPVSGGFETRLVNESSRSFAPSALAGICLEEIGRLGPSEAESTVESVIQSEKTRIFEEITGRKEELAAIESRAQRVESSQPALRALAARRRTLEAARERLAAQRAEADREVAAASKALGVQSERLAKVGEACARAQASLDRLREELKKQGITPEEAAALRREIAAKGRGLEELDARLGEKTAESRGLSSSLGEKEAAIEALAAEASALFSELGVEFSSFEFSAEAPAPAEFRRWVEARLGDIREALPRLDADLQAAERRESDLVFFLSSADSKKAGLAAKTAELRASIESQRNFQAEFARKIAGFSAESAQKKRELNEQLFLAENEKKSCDKRIEELQAKINSLQAEIRQLLVEDKMAKNALLEEKSNIVSSLMNLKQKKIQMINVTTSKAQNILNQINNYQ